MSKSLDLSEERKAQIVQEFVDMYIEKGGEYPTSREIKKNKYIAEWEVQVVKKLGLLEDWRVRKMAKEKTGINYPPVAGRHREHSAEASHNKSKSANLASQADEKKAEQKEVTDMTELEKVEKKTEEIVKVVEESNANIAATETNPQKISVEEPSSLDGLKRVLREFGEAHLHWPTDQEINDRRSRGVPGWRSSSEVRRVLGPKSSWKDQVFPEGLPDGFVTQNRGGNYERPQARKKPIGKKIEHENSDIKELERKIDWISKLFSDGHLDAVIETSNHFTMRSEVSARYKGKYIRFIFEVQENEE